MTSSAGNETLAPRSAPATTLSQRDWLVALWTLGVFFFLGVAIFARFYDRFPGDEWLTDTFQSVKVPSFGGYLDFTNVMGGTWVHSAVVVGIVVLLVLRRATWESLLMAFVFLPSLLNSFIKGLVERPRPSPELVDTHAVFGGFAFPSGHTVGTSALMLALFFVLPAVIRMKALRWLLQAGCVLLLVSAGPARVYVGAHWPSDVGGGYLLAALLMGPASYFYLVARGRDTRQPRSSGNP